MREKMTEWKLVPVEPTEEMREAGWTRYKDVGDIWSAMLAAAPAAPAMDVDGIMALADELRKTGMNITAVDFNGRDNEFAHERDTKARAALRAAVEAVVRENERLRLHIDKRAAGVDPLTQQLRERAERAEEGIVKATALIQARDNQIERAERALAEAQQGAYRQALEDAAKVCEEAVGGVTAVLNPPGQPGSYARGHFNGMCNCVAAIRGLGREHG